MAKTNIRYFIFNAETEEAYGVVDLKKIAEIVGRDPRTISSYFKKKNAFKIDQFLVATVTGIIKSERGKSPLRMRNLKRAEEING